MSYFLGVDLGGTVTKAGIYGPQGQEVAVFEHSVAPLTDGEGFYERNMDELWEAVCTVCRGALQKSGLKKEDIKGVSFSSHGKGLYPIDKNGKPVRNGINSSDTRAVGIVLDWLKDGTADKAYPYGMQQMWTGHPAAILKWLKIHERENYDKTAAILMVHDYIRFKMTGELGAEITNISGSNLYNVQTGAYDDKLLELFDIQECRTKTVKTVDSSEQCGSITQKAAEQTGLAQGTPVFGGFFDVVAAAISSGVIDDTALSAAAGTWSIATAVHQKISLHPHHYIWGSYCVPGLYFVHEGSATSASNLTFWRTHILKETSYDDLNAMVNNVLTSGPKPGLYYLPYVYGSNYKVGMTAGLCGLQSHHSMQDVIYAIFEGIVFSHTLNQDKVLAISPSIKTIRMNGGPTGSPPWMKMYASCAALPVEISEVKQTGCKAAAMAAAVGSGFFKDYIQAVKDTVRPMQIIEPDLKLHELMRQRYEDFLTLNEKLSA